MPSSHFKWSFSDERKSYALEQFHTYIKDTNLDDSILTNNSVPQIFAGPDPLDDYLKSQLNKIKKNEIQQDKSCQKVQEKNGKCNGFFNQNLEINWTATKSNSEKVELNLEDFKNLTEQTIWTLA